jgi:flagellar P-ring protein precursor FlgI
VAAKVVINERTGTIVMGENVRISPVAVAHGNLTVQITEQPAVSQPLPLSQGETVVTPHSAVQVQEGKGSLNLLRGGATIGEVINGLNAIGATPRDIITILQTIKAAGALHAELELI